MNYQITHALHHAIFLVTLVILCHWLLCHWLSYVIAYIAFVRVRLYINKKLYIC